MSEGRVFSHVVYPHFSHREKIGKKKIQWHGMTAQRKAELEQCSLCTVNRSAQKELLDCIVRYEPDPE